MKIRKLLLSLAAAAFLPSCATQYSVTPIPKDTAKSAYQDGMARLCSVKRNFVVIGPTSQTLGPEKQKEFLVAVQNRTSKAFDFDTVDVQVEYYDAVKNVTTKSKVYSYDELVKMEKTRQVWAAVAGGLAAAGDSMSAANAGYSTTSGNYHGNTYSSYGNTATSGSYTATTYNYAAANAAQSAARDRARYNANQIAAQGGANLDYLSALIVKRETVFPGKRYGGLIKFETPPLANGGKLRFQVNAGGDIHVLEFNVAKK